MSLRTIKKRRNECKTDYKSRFSLIKSGIPRIVIRKTNKYLILQLVESSESQDKTIKTTISSELLKYGLLADLIPKDESSRGLAREFFHIGLKGKRVLMPRSHISDKGLAEEFRRMGAAVAAPVGYRNVMPKDLPEIDLASFDEIMFTSPSTVRNFKKRYRSLPKKAAIRCIGDVTLKVFRKEFGKTRRVKVG